MKSSRIGLAAALLALLLAPAGESFGQISHVTVSKQIGHVQTSATTVIVDPEATGPNYGGPYGFHVNVEGQNIGGITAPTFTGPVNFAAVGSWYNGGRLVYNTEDQAWRSGTNGNDWGSPTLADLNSKFPNGTYTVTVNGTAIPLTLTGDAYPNVPLMTLSGGAWVNGKYVIDPSKPFTITTNAFTAYRSNVNGVMVLGTNTALIQGADQTPSPNFLTTTVPAFALAAGQEGEVFASFQAIVNVRSATAPIYSSARYEMYTLVTIKAETPVFPMTVTGSIGTQTANVTANIQYRPQDLGTTQSVYTFAVAPATVVQASTTKEAPLQIGWARDTAGLKETAVACVLCQLNASGQLQAVSASAMRAYVTGVLTSQGASVAILNGVPSINIGGAAFYVGYGTSATTMLSTGVNRRAIAAPGSLVCDPGAPQAGWWWNTTEGGRGYSIEAQGRNIFYAAFLYDESGRSKWYVATGPTSIDGALYTGDLLEARGGQTLTGAYRAPAISTVGPFTLVFNNQASGTMSWPGGNVPSERFNIVANGVNVAPVAGQPESGWWWNPAESGRGFFIEWQGNTFDLAGYMYDDQGNPVWYLAVYSTADITRAAGSWWTYANGQT
ncbi:MAG: hypothetical protein ABIR98_01235, partial [Usitatibacter sp.]